MNLFFKITGILLTVLIVGILGLLGFVKLALPSTGKAPEMKVELTTSNIEKGKYLANQVMGCMCCHSRRDWNEFSGTVVEGTRGMGGTLFDNKYGLQGTYYASNITPAGLSEWTDGEIFRAITTGVSRNGKALSPVMPYLEYGLADENDIKSVIAYLRTLTPIENKVIESISDFPMNFIINTIPRKASLKRKPSEDSTNDYGRYLAAVSGCRNCHTPYRKGEFDSTLAFAGGREFLIQTGKLVSSNITPDIATGIGKWKKEEFIAHFKSFVDSNNNAMHLPIGENGFNTNMPWTLLGGMTESDLGAIYDYLRTLGPVNNSINKFIPGQ